MNSIKDILLLALFLNLPSMNNVSRGAASDLEDVCRRTSLPNDRETRLIDNFEREIAAQEEFEDQIEVYKIILNNEEESNPNELRLAAEEIYLNHKNLPELENAIQVLKSDVLNLSPEQVIIEHLKLLDKYTDDPAFFEDKDWLRLRREHWIRELKNNPNPIVTKSIKKLLLRSRNQDDKLSGCFSEILST